MTKTVAEREALLEKMREDLKKLTLRKYATVQDYLHAVRKSGYGVKEHLGKEGGQLRGYSVEKEGESFHASDIGRQFSLTELAKASIIGLVKKAFQQGYDPDKGEERGMGM